MKRLTQNKRTNAVLHSAEKAGCRVVAGRSGHIRVTCPNGNAFTVGGTAKNEMQYRAVLRDLHKYGDIDLKEHK